MSKTFAIMSGDSVDNIIVADTLEIAQDATGQICIEYTDAYPAGIGWTYDGVKFIAPVVPSDV